MREKLNEIIAGYKKAGKSGLSLKFLDCQKKEENTLKLLKDNLSQISMFREKKLIVIFNPFSDTLFKEGFKKDKIFLNSDDIVILYEDGEIKKTDALFKFLEKNAKCQKFEILSGLKLKKWVKEKFSEAGSMASSEAESLLLAFCGNDLWRLDNEIRKIALFKKGREAESEDIRMLVKPKIETDIFKTVDALGEKDKKQALRFIHKHITKGDSPIYILSMINYQFRNLLIMKDLIEKGIPFAAAAKKIGMHPFVARKAFYQSQRFSMSELKKIYRSIFQTDLEIKTGKKEPVSGLENLIIEV